MNMKPFKKLHLLHCLLALNVMLGSSISNHDHRNYYCRNIRTQKPFLNQNSSISSSSLLSSITLCRSQNLYFRTSLGLFQVSSIDFDGRILTISHSSSCSSSSLEYVSPLAVTSGFPSPPEPNSLILFNCSRKIDPFSPFMRICTNSHKCGVSARTNNNENHDEENHYSCLVVEDLQKVEEGFHPKDLNCTHYMWAHRRSSSSSDGEEFKYGARLSFDIPAVPEICKGCVKPNGTCGGGLNCLCHAKECKDKVISKVGSIKSIGSVFFSLFITFLSMVQ